MPQQLANQILTDELVDHIAGLPEKEARDYIFLDPSDKYPGRWYVDGLNPAFFMDFEEQIGPYRIVSPASLEEFLDRAKQLAYHVLFTEDPVEILSAWEHLNDPPEFSLNSTMENTVNGFLPFQLQGFNFLRQTEKGGLAIWSTGTGKTALEAGLTKQHIEVEDFDLGLIVCKRNNKIDTLRKLYSLGSIDYAYIFEGTPDQRDVIYSSFLEELDAGQRLVGITNYEKWRDDTEWFEQLVDGRKVFICWDEMPTKLSNRTTQLYYAVRDCLYDVENWRIEWDQRRPEVLRQYDLSATPIENNPVGLLNQVRLIDPDVWPVIKQWERKYVKRYNRFSHEPEVFHNDKLDLMGLEIAHITHQVDKDDPDIAKLFPEVREDTIYVDWSPEDRRVYEIMEDIAADLMDRAKAGEEVKTISPIQLIGVLRMLCDAPSMVQHSGENRQEFEAALALVEDEDEYEELQEFVSGAEAARILIERLNKPLTDDHCEKLNKLRELVCEKHAGEKGIVFSAWSTYIFPVLERAFDDWGITYVTYKGTDKQRQEAKDRFRTDPDIQIFLSSDAGSDSIDLPEASHVTDYDLPLKYATKIQRRNRAHRINSEHESVWFYSLQMPNSVEDRLAELIERKKGYHMGIFRGEIAEESISARMTANDLYYIITGQWPED